MLEKMNLKDLTYGALFAALICVLGLISIPLSFSPVPITGQSLAIMLAGCILTTRQAALSVATFLLIGIVGVPVFAGGTAGIGIILGPRGGYLIGFFIGAIVISLLKGKNNTYVRLGISNVVGGIGIVYLLGVIWLSIVTQIGLSKAFMVGALPFIAGDLFKVFVATIVSVTVNKRLQKKIFS